jgi:hypothetical protein
VEEASPEALPCVTRTLEAIKAIVVMRCKETDESMRDMVDISNQYVARRMKMKSPTAPIRSIENTCPLASLAFKHNNPVDIAYEKISVIRNTEINRRSQDRGRIDRILPEHKHAAVHRRKIIAGPAYG